jgi:hypothetical protein
MSKEAIPFTLDDELKRQILEEFEKTPDLMTITRIVFQDESLDGRSHQGRAVKKFLSELNLEYKTVEVSQPSKKELTPEQKAFLLSDNIENGITALDAARLCFKDRSIASLSSEHRMVLDFLKEFRTDITEEQPVVDRWLAPKALSRAIKKVNDWTGSNFDELTMPTKQKKFCEKLLLYLQTVRFRETINQFSTHSDRELFESEFVRAAWDKPDLTVDEQNLYINMCSNYVRLKHLQKRLDSLNRQLDDMDNQQDATIRFTTLVQATAEDLNACEKRIEALANNLNGSRQKRLADKGENGGSILALVEAFQAKEERDRMVLMAQHKNKFIEEEADRLESMDELKARILGFSKQELL